MDLGATGRSADLHSSLEMGLRPLQDVSESERLVLLFSAASSICLVEDPNYQNLLLPYVTHPINPVKVMTYIVGSTELSRTDPISYLTGGARFMITSIHDLYPVVDASAEHIRDSLIRGVRLEIVPPGWNRKEIEIEWNGYMVDNYPSFIIALRDMKPGESQSMKLKMDLDEWTGDADVFEYSVSYFNMDQMRWYKTPFKSLRLRRTSEKALEERMKQKAHVIEGLNRAVVHLQQRQIWKASHAVRASLYLIAESTCQDDSLILSFSHFLAILHKEILKLDKDHPKEIDQLINKLISDSAQFGLEITPKNEEPASSVSSVAFFLSVPLAIGIVVFIGL